MTEYVEREVEDQQADVHLVYRPDVMDTRARAMYDSLREANQWLPPADHVPADSDLILVFGANSVTTLTLTVFINLPEGFHDRAQA